MTKPTYKLAAGALVLVAALFASAPCAAQDMVMPIVGRQFLTTGLALNPGIIYDATAPERFGSSRASAAAASMLRLGLHHILSTGFSMSGELELGAQWMAAHTATPAGLSEPQTAFALQLGLIGRWFPLEVRRGWTVGLGTHYYRAWLRDAPLQLLAFEARIGRFFWISDERFLILELGYGFPFIQGLRLAQDFGTGTREPVERSWSFHRLSLGFNLTW
ncbi:MAG: hypothetical protein H0U74_23280 [Bradymonadaceae bacterium]|nr:hypothetical protein [Lujinxingiaceae bacterium]